METLKKTGIPLGIFAETAWETRSVSLDPQAMLVLYTDGVTEAAGPNERSFGERRLQHAIRQAYGSQEPQKVLQGVLSSVDAFRAQTPQSDDIALVIVARR